MNRKRIKQLIVILKKVQELEKNSVFSAPIFSLNHWYSWSSEVSLSSVLKTHKKNLQTKTPVACDFSACALGWASLDVSFQKAGLKPSQTGVPIYQTEEKVYEGYDAAQHFFDLDEKMTYFLFCPVSYKSWLGEPETPFIEDSSSGEIPVARVIHRLHIALTYYSLEYREL